MPMVTDGDGPLSPLVHGLMVGSGSESSASLCITPI